MGRTIVVMSNCQTGGLSATIDALFPDDRIVPIAWLGREPPGLRDLLADADAWVCSLPRDDAEALLAASGSRAQLVLVPTIWFPAFHPDLTPVLRRDGRELDGPAMTYHSRLVLWGWAHGWDRAEIVDRFTPATFAGLGYHDTWAPSVAGVRRAFAATDLDVDRWLLPLVPRGAFMLTSNHPRLDALVQMGRLAAEHLGADADRLRFDWEQVLPDGLLATSVVWPLYPPVAATYGLPGAYVWRLESGELIGLDEYVERSLDRYATLDPAELDLAHVLTDARFRTHVGHEPVAAPAGGR